MAGPNFRYVCDLGGGTCTWQVLTLDMYVTWGGGTCTWQVLTLDMYVTGGRGGALNVVAGPNFRYVCDRGGGGGPCTWQVLTLDMYVTGGRGGGTCMWQVLTLDMYVTGGGGHLYVSGPNFRYVCDWGGRGGGVHLM